MRLDRALALGWLALAVAAPAGAASGPLPEGAPLASVDLATREGVAAVGGQWRHAETRLVEVEHRRPDAEGQPAGEPVRTWSFEPRAGAIDFDDSGWEVVDPLTLVRRRGRGRLGFDWYRIRLTIPERVGDFDPSGSTAVFEVVVDDYAEIWVDGELPRGVGQRGGSVVAGWNAPNRLVVGRDLRPGQRIQLAVFVANAPLSDPPANFVWVRSARLDFHHSTLSGPYAIAPEEVNLEVVRLDPGLDAIVPANPKAWKLAEGFRFTEGPVWLPDQGALLLSDPDANCIYRYDPREGGRLEVFRERSGYDGADIAEYRQPGSNGLALDPQGRLTIDEHGRRRVVRLEPDGSLVVLADRYRGRRLNSPNDLIFGSDGTLYFTDPPFGLPRFEADPRRELDFSGVYALRDGELRLLDRELRGPNGIALSPDEGFLYVANWDPARKVVMRWQVEPDGSLAHGRVFLDLGDAPGEEALDGLEVDRAGNLYVSGPGGLWIVSPEGRRLGTLRLPRLPANFAWGDADGRTLYLTARTTLYRVPLRIEGVRR